MVGDAWVFGTMSAPLTDLSGGDSTVTESFPGVGTTVDTRRGILTAFPTFVEGVALLVDC